MKVIVGGGTVGTELAKRLGHLIVEEAPQLGGIHAYDEMAGTRVPLQPVLSEEVCTSSYLELEIRKAYEKDEYLEEKVCRGPCPKWFRAERAKYLLFPEFDKVNWIKGRAKTVKGKKLILQGFSQLDFDELYLASPPEELGLIRPREFLSVATIIAVLKSWDKDWDLKVSGDDLKLYNRLIHLELDGMHVLYVESYFSKVPPSWDRVKADLKRFERIDLEKAVSVRYRIIKYAVLLGGGETGLPEGIKVCGRFKQWSNPTFCESTRLALEC